MARQWVFLVGFMGSGKSTWGRKIATRLDANFVDLDKLIELESPVFVSEKQKFYVPYPANQAIVQTVSRPLLQREAGLPVFTKTCPG